MRKATRISLALVTSAAMVGLAALPASAAEEDGTVPVSTEASATIEVEGGELSISVASNVAAEAALEPGTKAEIAIPPLTVTDTRASVADWTVRVALSDFTSANADAPDALIPAVGATYLTAAPTFTGTVTPAPVGGEFAEAGEVIALAATAVRGNNTATWTSSLTIPVPSDALAGIYTATLTHSAL